MRKIPGDGKKLTFYDFGRTIVYASRLDQRFPYCVYVPDDYDEDSDKTYPIAVIVHGTERDMQGYREAFIDFAEENGVIVLVPLFPASVVRPGDINSYKMLRYGDVHYDAVMLDMIEELRERYRIDGDKVLMYGFSGGGQFTHRFLYLHPERVLAASIGGPGTVTLLDPDRDFWVGTRNFETVFGKPLDLDVMRAIPVHMIIGGNDHNTWEITIKPTDRWWMDDANIAGVDRVDRIVSLKNSFEKFGINVTFDVVPDVAHDDRTMLPLVKSFFAKVLRDHRARDL
ncbi:hydrolase [Agrobacterium tumefaciens]|uniref:hydrolase n=1 Tax=Agrobacterium tumefaciens TaxID=358 RepID=UPI0009774F85|nr:hydrolase [Agrobacterium tumefaciens]